MTGGIRVDLVAVGRLDVISGFQLPGAERNGLIMGGLDVIDVQVKVDLLRRPIGPLRRNVIGLELNAQPPFAVDGDTVPVVLRVDRAAQQPVQKVLSAVRSAASSTTICRVIFMRSSFHGLDEVAGPCDVAGG